MHNFTYLWNLEGVKYIQKVEWYFSREVNKDILVLSKNLKLCSKSKSRDLINIIMITSVTIGLNSGKIFRVYFSCSQIHKYAYISTYIFNIEVN